MVEKALSVLFARIQDPSGDAEHVVLDAQLVVRGTVRDLAGGPREQG